MELKNQIPCKECGGKAKIDFSSKYLSNPPKYDAICENCGHRFYVREPDLIIKPGEELGTLKIKKFHPDAIIPTRSYPADAGLDIYALEDTYVQSTHASMITTGVAVDIPVGYEGTIRPRSGKTAKTNLRVQLGTVDAGYNGEVKVIADTLNNSTYLVRAGEKIAQLVIQKVELPIFEMVDDFDTQSERGNNGFGSTDEVLP